MVVLVLGLGLAVPAHADTIAITNATVYARPDHKLEHATVVIRDGKIAAVGKVRPPAGAQVIDGSGKIVTAGLIEASSMLGLVEVDAEASGNDGTFGVKPVEVHAAYRASDAFDASSVAIPVARAGGVTSAIVGPRGGLVAGQASWISTAVGAVKPLVPTIAMNAALGAPATELASRGYAVEHMRRLLDDVAAYRRNKVEFEKNKSRKFAGTRLDREALVPVLAGRRLLVIAADSEVDIRAALAIAAERKLRIAIAGGDEAWRVAPELARAKVPVLLDASSNLPGSISAADVRDDNAAVLVKAGVPLAITTLGNASAARTIRQLAGIAVANGLPWAQGLAAITQVPAQIFGLDRGPLARGTIERGKVADVVIWTGDPLEVTTRVDTVIENGVVQPLSTHQTRLRDRYRHLPVRPLSTTP